MVGEMENEVAAKNFVGNRCQCLETQTHFKVEINSVETKNEADEVLIGGFTQLFADGAFKFAIYETIDLDEKVPVTDEALRQNLPLYEIEREIVTHSIRYLLIEGADWWGVLRIHSVNMSVHIGGKSREKCAEIFAPLERAFRVEKVKNEEIGYRVLSENEYPTFARTAAIKWEEIQKNYPKSTRIELEKLINYRRDFNSPDPRLVVMQGAPGVGKTWFERALMYEWREWADFAVVADSECLFGDGGTSYFMKIIESSPRDRTRVLVLEDTPDDIVTGARSGGLGRLLGLTDGLVACSKSIMVLLSTNTNLSDLDPALMRSGRALHKVKFEKFPPSEASARLGEFGPATTELSLADIYVRIGQSKSLSKEETISVGTYL